MGCFFTGWMSIFPDIIDKLFGDHRGLGHSIFWIILCLLVGLGDVTISVALVCGIVSHFLLDAITLNRSPILYPIWKTNFVILNKKKRLKTGTNHDKALFIVLIFYSYLYYYSHYNHTNITLIKT